MSPVIFISAALALIALISTLRLAMLMKGGAFGRVFLLLAVAIIFLVFHDIFNEFVGEILGGGEEAKETFEIVAESFELVGWIILIALAWTASKGLAMKKSVSK